MLDNVRGRRGQWKIEGKVCCENKVKRKSLDFERQPDPIFIITVRKYALRIG